MGTHEGLPHAHADGSGSKPHVAFLPSPGMGHLTPLLQLAIRLATHHHFQVTFLLFPTDAQHHFPNLPLPPDLRLIHLPSADVSNLLSRDTTLVARICLTVRHSLRPLHSILSGLNPKPKALVIDLFCTDAMETSTHLSIPVFSFFTASTALLAFSLYLPTLDREVEGEFVDLPEPVKVPGCTPIPVQDLLDQVRNRKIDEYRWYLFHMRRLPMARGIFANTWEDLDPVWLKAVQHEPFFQSIHTPPVYPIGPLTKDIEPNLADHEKEILTWLDKQPKDSVLFIALGSGGTLTSLQLTELAWGLELSQQRFILVARKPSDASASAVFFGVGSDSDDPRAYLPEGFVVRTNRVGLVVPSWAPQVAVLDHSSTGAFLSHCGWNSSLESVKNGVPIIGWPLYAEQRMNATMLSEEVGVAVKMAVVGGGGETVLVGRDEIERVVRAVMEGEVGHKLRSRARELRVSAEETLSCGGSSYESLVRVTESWKTDSLEQLP